MEHLEPIAHLVPEIKDLFANKLFDVIKDALTDIRPQDLAESWYRFSTDERIGIFTLIDPKDALVLFESLSVQDQKELLKCMDENRIATLLEGIQGTDMRELFSTLPEKTVKRMMSLVKKDQAIRRIEQLLKYDPETAGALLDPEFIQLNPKTTAKSALTIIHSVARLDQKKHLRSLYVTSSRGELLGQVTVESLVIAPPDSMLEDFMTSVDHMKLSPHMDQETVASIFAKYALSSAPVVDEKGNMLGIVYVDNIIDVIKKEATEDIAKMAGTRAEEIRESSIFKIAWYRAPWLLATLGIQFLVSIVIRFFQPVLGEVIALASFMPLIPAMGGNVGAQSAMIFVRTMAIGNFKGRDKYMAVLREMGIGLCLGVFYGSITGVLAHLIYGHAFGISFSLVVGISLIAAMTMAAMAGAIGPIVLEKLGIDPATATGPMVTTTTDLMGLTVYFILATLLLTGH